MSRFKYLFNSLSAIIILSLLNACIPVAVLGPNPDSSIETVLPKSFLNQENAKYLVIPFWGKTPFVYYDDHKQEVEIILGDGFLVGNNEIPDLHQKIPKKFIIGIGSLYGNVARDFVLKGVILISESQDIVFVAARKTPGKILVMQWGEAIEIFICDSQKTILKSMIDKGAVDKDSFSELFEKTIKPQLNTHDPQARDLLQMIIKLSCPQLENDML